ncbi:MULTISPECIES: hypothetical protein [Flavobacteriaceae]|uniref:hypothetical protein n=1 Tax=Flavobacteriaceae TaxID=49546 RepID=UPI0014917A02|nr:MULTISPECIES: hypothetical protein [Allomuricauda]MDC6365445.1 hypothetical protein [Muricauda sp. AC10]
MKHLFLTLLFYVCTTSFLQAQENYVDLVQIGDQLTLGTPSGNHYKYISVPRKNFILKRGGIGDISSLVNQKITITNISYGKVAKVTFKKTNGGKFFRVYKTFTADFNKAVDAGEIKIPSSTSQVAIVK